MRTSYFINQVGTRITYHVSRQDVQRGTWNVRRKGQSAIEFAVLIIVIIAAFIAMQVYLKRGIQGRLRGSVDQIGEQYDPNATTSRFTIGHESNITTILTTGAEEVSVTADGVTATDLVSISTSNTITHYDNSTRSGWERVLAP